VKNPQNRKNAPEMRRATISDSEPIANALWRIWRQFKVRQIPSSMHKYPSSKALDAEIRSDLSRWLVCEPSGFFSLCPIGDDKTYKRWGFPQHAVRVEYFACLLTGEAILQHLRLLVLHISEQSILLCIPASLRDAQWAALKAGFRELGDSSLIVGAFVWLYFDREGRHDAIQAKLRRAKIVT
jgi:hypothetical protein